MVLGVPFFILVFTLQPTASSTPSRYLRASGVAEADAADVAAQGTDGLASPIDLLDLPLDEEDELDNRRPWERVDDSFDFDDQSGEATGVSFQDLLNFTSAPSVDGDFGTAFGDDIGSPSDRSSWTSMPTETGNENGDSSINDHEEVDDQVSQLDAAKRVADSTMGSDLRKFKDSLDTVVGDVLSYDDANVSSDEGLADGASEAVDKEKSADESSSTLSGPSTALTNLESVESQEVSDAGPPNDDTFMRTLPDKEVFNMVSVDSPSNLLRTSSQNSNEPAPPIVEEIHHKGRAPSILIAVFSRRDAGQQRALVRDMWIRAVASSEGNATMRFTVCQADDGKNDALELEHAIHGDILVLDCEEGYGHGLLTRKVIASMKVFQNSFKGLELFMKIDDDSFVSWHKLSSILITRAHPNAYIGVPIGKSVPCRNASFRWYEPFDTYPYEYFPKAMAGGPGYTLGRHLVERILETGVAEQNLLWNEDRAVGVWINRLRKSHGLAVEYVALNGVDGWWGWNWKKPQASWKVWGDYPHTVHHGLRGDTIACLALADVRNKPDRRIDTCFAFEVGQEHEALKCAMQTYQKPSLLQKGSFVKKRLRTSSTHKAATNEKRKSELRGDVEFGVPRGSTPDWKTHRQRLIFVHIPKNGGTAIEQAGQAGGVWWPRKWLSFWHGLHMPDGSWCEKYHVPPQYLKSLGDPDAFVFDDPGTFCVTRHPFDRAVSEYKYMLSVKWGRSMSEMYDTGLYDKPRCTPEGLNHFLQKALTNFLKGKRFQHDCHMVPQTDFIWGKDGQQWCRHVLSSENLVPSFNKLMADHRYEVRLNDSRTNNSSDACPGLSVNSLELKTKRMLATVYEHDLRRLNYSSGLKTVQFLHIPRNGGATISELGLSQHVSWGRKIVPYAQRAQLPDTNWCEKHHTPIRHREPEEQEEFNGAEVFCVSRHPYERAVSAYKALAAMKDYDQLMRADGLQSLLHAKQCSMVNLNEFLQTAARLLQSGQSFALDCQMAPQSEYIFHPDGSRACDVVLRHKELPSNFNALMNNKGFPQVQMNASAPRLRSTEKQCHDLSVTSLSAETRKALDALYAKDFDQLNYTRW